MQHFYFDHNAASPVAPEVLRDVAEAMPEVYGNASSIHHFGQAAKRRLEAARRTVAVRLGCSDREIVFTGGGTESDNLAIFGVARREKSRPGHAVTSAIDRSSSTATTVSGPAPAAASTRASRSAAASSPA